MCIVYQELVEGAYEVIMVGYYWGNIPSREGFVYVLRVCMHRDFVSYSTLIII
jgi:hypothetical protein